MPYSNEIFIVAVGHVEAFAGRVVFEQFHQQLLADVDVRAVQFTAVIGRLVELLRQSHR